MDVAALEEFSAATNQEVGADATRLKPRPTPPMPKAGLDSIAHHPSLAKLHDKRFAVIRSEGVTTGHLAKIQEI